MTLGTKYVLIINPSSSAGRTGKLQSKIITLLKERANGNLFWLTTKASREATTLARRAIENGVNLIVAVGGDGTVNEIVNGFFENDKMIRPASRLGIIASGTGVGLASSLNLPQQIEEQISTILDGNIRSIDVCRLTYIDFDKAVRTRYFVNECQIGIGATVVSRVQPRHKIFGGSVAFAWGSLKSIVGAKSYRLIVNIDNNEEKQFHLHGMTIGNGSFMGGSMNLTPKARLDDGLFDVLFIHHQSLCNRLYGFSKIYSGNHIGLPHVGYQQCKMITIESPDRVLVATDGELLGTLPCKIEIIPNILHICVPSTKENHQ
jgi:diacylglycerol kinase (ATP)